MGKVGIICDLNYSRHTLFISYYYTVKNLFGSPRIVNSVDDLYGIKLLFIGDDHYYIHKDIWQSEGFIAYCNVNNIKVVVLTNEKILDSYFPWNVNNLKLLEKFKYLYHYVSDVDDCIKLGLKIHRMQPSLHFKNVMTIDATKKDRIVFIGKVDCPMDSYNDRKLLLEKIKKVIEIDIIDVTKGIEWEKYLQITAGYRFALSPFGVGNFFPMRFYEALLVKSIPIQQIKENTLQYYDVEATFDDCIFFQKPDEIPEKIQNCTLKSSHTKVWLEDSLKKRLEEDHLI